MVALLDRLDADRAEDWLVLVIDVPGCHVSKASSGQVWAFLRPPTLIALGVVLPLTRSVASLTGADRSTTERAHLVAASVESLLAARHDHVIRA
jgi:hypothetical protein